MKPALLRLYLILTFIVAVLFACMPAQESGDPLATPAVEQDGRVVEAALTAGHDPLEGTMWDLVSEGKPLPRSFTLVTRIGCGFCHKAKGCKLLLSNYSNQY